MEPDVETQIKPYRFPPVDPVTGDVSADDNAISMGPMRHCDVPLVHHKFGCVEIMDHHGWIDDGSLLGVVICPTAPGVAVAPIEFSPSGP